MISDIVAYIDATSNFSLKIRIEKVGGDRIRTAVSSPRHLCLSEEETVRLRGGEVMFHRLEISSETAYVVEVNIEKVGGGIWTPLVVTLRLVRPEDISPDGDPKAGSEAISILCKF